jgi:Rrf2 family iron-sulfur cluster assembly transcriptional regulator
VADSVSVADIITAVDEPIDATQCGGKENCLDDRRCMTHELWASLNTHIFSFLSSVSLEQLVRQQDKPEVTVLQDHRPPGKKPEPAAVV